MTLDWLFRTSPANSVRGARLVGSGVGPIGARLMLVGLAAALGVVANARAGDATTTELIEAETAMTRASQEYQAAIFDYLA